VNAANVIIRINEALQMIIVSSVRYILYCCKEFIVVSHLVYVSVHVLQIFIETYIRYELMQRARNIDSTLKKLIQH